jgi:hypothetical protein
VQQKERIGVMAVVTRITSATPTLLGVFCESHAARDAGRHSRYHYPMCRYSSLAVAGSTAVGNIEETFLAALKSQRFRSGRKLAGYAQ